MIAAIHSVQWSVWGEFSSGTETLNCDIQNSLTIDTLEWNISADCGALPVGDNAVFDVQLSSDRGVSWESVFPEGVRLIVPAAGPWYGQTTDFAIQRVNAGDWMKLVCETPGIGTPGSGLQAILYGEELEDDMAATLYPPPSGLTITWADAAPTTGVHTQGSIVYARHPVLGGHIGWVCTTSGTPGIWATFGQISE